MGTRLVWSDFPFWFAYAEPTEECHGKCVQRLRRVPWRVTAARIDLSCYPPKHHTVHAYIGILHDAGAHNDCFSVSFHPDGRHVVSAPGNHQAAPKTIGPPFLSPRGRWAGGWGVMQVSGGYDSVVRLYDVSQVGHRPQLLFLKYSQM
jgi:hypothetical protein